MNNSTSPVHGDEDATITTAVSGTVIGLAIISVALRFYSRFYVKAKLMWDDWLILLSVITTLLTGVLLLWATAVDPNSDWVTSNTDPNYNYTPANIFHLKLSFIASILYFTIASSAKLSILLMYNRIFSVSQSFRIQVFIVGLLVSFFWIGCTIATLTNCIPLKWSWLNSLSLKQYCFNYNYFWVSSGALETALDVVIIAMPVRTVSGMQMKTKTKIRVACVFGLGIFAVVTGLVKVILGYVPGSRVPSYPRTEVWTTVHVGMTIVCACLPVCWPVLNRIFSLSSTTMKKLFTPGNSTSDASRVSMSTI